MGGLADWFRRVVGISQHEVRCGAGDRSQTRLLTLGAYAERGMGRLAWVVADQACLYRFAHLCAQGFSAGPGQSGHVTKTYGELVHWSQAHPQSL